MQDAVRVPYFKHLPCHHLKNRPSVRFSAKTSRKTVETNKPEAPFRGPVANRGQAPRVQDLHAATAVLKNLRCSQRQLRLTAPCTCISGLANSALWARLQRDPPNRSPKRSISVQTMCEGQRRKQARPPGRHMADGRHAPCLEEANAATRPDNEGERRYEHQRHLGSERPD